MTEKNSMSIIEYSLCVFDFNRTKLIQRLSLPCPPPIYPQNHTMIIGGDWYSVVSCNTSIVPNDGNTFICYVTDVVVKPFNY